LNIRIKLLPGVKYLGSYIYDVKYDLDHEDHSTLFPYNGKLLDFYENQVNDDNGTSIYSKFLNNNRNMENIFKNLGSNFKWIGDYIPIWIRSEILDNKIMNDADIPDPKLFKICFNSKDPYPHEIINYFPYKHKFCYPDANGLFNENNFDFINMHQEFAQDGEVKIKFEEMKWWVKDIEIKNNFCTLDLAPSCYALNVWLEDRRKADHGDNDYALSTLFNKYC
jgi:hypothetical protein